MIVYMLQSMDQHSSQFQFISLSLSAVEGCSCPFSLGLPVLELKAVADTVYQENLVWWAAGKCQRISFPRVQPSISSLYITLAAFKTAKIQLLQIQPPRVTRVHFACFWGSSFSIVNAVWNKRFYTQGISCNVNLHVDTRIQNASMDWLRHSIWLYSVNKITSN